MSTNSEDRTRRPWLALIVSLLLVSIGGTVWQSFTTLQLHAVHVGWHTPAVLPIIIDAFYVATLAAYIRRPDRYTLLASLCAALVSSAGNALAYLYDPASAYLVAPMPIVIATGIVPPVFALGVAHFLVHERKAAHAARHVDRSPVVEPAGGDPGTGDRSADSGADVGSGLLEVSTKLARKSAAAAPRAQNGVRPARTPSSGDLERAQRVREHDWQTVKLEELMDAQHLDCGYVSAQRARALASNGAGAQSG